MATKQAKASATKHTRRRKKSDTVTTRSPSPGEPRGNLQARSNWFSKRRETKR